VCVCVRARARVRAYRSVLLFNTWSEAPRNVPPLHKSSDDDNNNLNYLNNNNNNNNNLNYLNNPVLSCPSLDLLPEIEIASASANWHQVALQETQEEAAGTGAGGGEMGVWGGGGAYPYG